MLSFFVVRHLSLGAPLAAMILSLLEKSG